MGAKLCAGCCCVQAVGCCGRQEGEAASRNNGEKWEGGRSRPDVELHCGNGQASSSHKHKLVSPSASSLSLFLVHTRQSSQANRVTSFLPSQASAASIDKHQLTTAHVPTLTIITMKTFVLIAAGAALAAAQDLGSLPQCGVSRNCSLSAQARHYNQSGHLRFLNAANGHAKTRIA